MNRTLSEIAADFDALMPEDFDDMNVDADGSERLYRLCDEVLSVGDADASAPVLFRTMERLDGADLGSPGPLVHTLEKWRGVYEPYLAESIRRRPSPLTVWMVNRILNVHPSNAGEWFELLQSVAHNPSASALTKARAQEFIDHQRSSLD